MPTSRISRLEAVNTILRAVGETPVSSLSTQSGVDSIMAQQTLDEVMRSVQAIGWTWNRRPLTLTPDSTGAVPVPGDCIRLEAYRGKHFTIRSGSLFDMGLGLAIFSEPLTVNVVELLLWDDLPQPARQYITVKAARIYADRSVGDDSLSRFTRQDEAEAYAVLRKDEMAMGKYTIFAPEDAGFINRGSPLNWND